MSEYVKELQMHIRDREYKIEKLKQENQKLKEALKVAVEALESAKKDFNDLDTILMADHKIVLSGFSRARLDIQKNISKIKALGIVKEG